MLKPFEGYEEGKDGGRGVGTGQPCRIGWSDFNFFAIFENGHIAVDWLYFYELNSKIVFDLVKGIWNFGVSLHF